MEYTLRYIELLKKALINELYIENEAKLFYMIQSLVEGQPISFDLLVNPDLIPGGLLGEVAEAKQEGKTLTLRVKDSHGQWQPAHKFRNVLEFPHSMIGRKRMDNIQHCIENLLSDDIPGDLLEAGVWRGGATIFMRGVLEAYGVHDRTVWVADSFEGLPAPSLPQDEGLDLTKESFPVLAVALEKVKALFERYDLLDDQVKFLKGWFKDTLPLAPIEKLALLRLDGDLYESTIDALNALYDKVVPGGFVIIDDYHALEVCRQAVHDYRNEHGIKDELIRIDSASVFWRKA